MYCTHKQTDVSKKQVYQLMKVLSRDERKLNVKEIKDDPITCKMISSEVLHKRQQQNVQMYFVYLFQ